jgi:hypothetical protein
MGYEEYIQRVLRPIAGDKPLLITEFGVNTLEAEESRAAAMLREAWRAIRRHTAGGIVFAFADEPWKHYDNPVRPGSWWDRRPDPDDELTHDQDPEEHYGLVTIDRQPKETFEAVAALFAPRFPTARLVPASILAALIAMGLGAWVVARWHGRISDCATSRRRR